MKTPHAWYVSMGSGQTIADPYLSLMRQVLWKSGPPNVQGGKLAAVWVMTHAIAAAVGFISLPIEIAVLQKQKGNYCAAFVTPDELQEHFESAKKADEQFARFFEEMRDVAGAPSIPPPPPTLTP